MKTKPTPTPPVNESWEKDKVAEKVMREIVMINNHPDGREFWLKGDLDPEMVQIIIHKALSTARQEERERIKHKIYAIRANMPLTGGEYARKQMKEFLAELESVDSLTSKGGTND